VLGSDRLETALQPNDLERRPPRACTRNATMAPLQDGLLVDPLPLREARAGKRDHLRPEQVAIGAIGEDRDHDGVPVCCRARGARVSMILHSATVPWLQELRTRLNSGRRDLRSRTLRSISVRWTRAMPSTASQDCALSSESVSSSRTASSVKPRSRARRMSAGHSHGAGASTKRLAIARRSRLNPSHAGIRRACTNRRDDQTVRLVCDGTAR
jgi:hypothetical protein